MSGFKDVPVVVDDSKRSAARIEVAVHVANRFGAHLTGLYVNPPAMTPALIQAEMSGGMGSPVILPTQAVNDMCDAVSQARRLHPGDPPDHDGPGSDVALMGAIIAND